MRQFDCCGILRALTHHGVEFIVVGGVAAVLQGAPFCTWDLDVLYRRDSSNTERALAALRLLMHPNPAPNAADFESPGPKALVTNLGRLDLLGSVGRQLIYEDLIDQADELKVEEFSVRVLRLERLIQFKEELGGEKDLAMLPTLRRTLEEKRKLK
jgi:predicted nucleotidyltransferase